MTIFLCASTALCLTFISLECVRVLQATCYLPWRGYFKVLFTRHFLYLCLAQVVCTALNFLCDYKWLQTLFVAIFSLLVNCSVAKTPLKFTKRVYRLLVTCFLAYFAACMLFGLWQWIILVPFFTVLGYFLTLPVECLINRRYLVMASRKLADYPLQVIAVTGSYGKTTTKNMLSQLLTGSITPPGSCNTPLGIAAFINKTELYGVKYLVLEFGARKRGDVRKLCSLYKPTFGVVTGVCPQHMATFKTFGNVIAAKRELVECLPQRGVCLLNGADSILPSFAQAGICKKVVVGKQADVQVDSVTLLGTHLSVKCRGNSAQVFLPQFANYTASTFKLCLVACNCLHQPFNETIANTAHVTQTEHRMQCTYNGVYHVVDDSYNAGISGVTNCCNTLARFDGYKVVIAQGITEGGSSGNTLNEQCGKLLGQTFSLCILVGKNSPNLAKGVRQVQGKCVFADNLHQAVQIANAHLGKNDLLLFQNDLPDTANV